MSAARQEFGELGERIAERWLRRQGWRVVQRRFRAGHRDIDLVVERDGTVAFVEVKARRGAEFGDPVEAVNWSKQTAVSSLRLSLDRPAWTAVGVVPVRRRRRAGGGRDGFEFDTSPTRFPSHIPLEICAASSYFVRVSKSRAFPVRLRCMARADYN